MSRRRSLLAVPAFVAATLFCASTASAQIASGHALDNSLRVGDGGYNYQTSRGGPPLQATRYSASRAANRAYWRPEGGNIQRIADSESRITNQDVFFAEKSYNASRQSTSYAGPPRGSGSSGAGYNPGATRVETRIE